jgi:protein gp37/ParB-like chromosome segregation protein Spo0J
MSNNGTLIAQEFIDVQCLIPHPRNNEFYGDPRLASDFDAFVEYVRRNGIHPLIVADDMTIIGGHRRYYAAIILGIPFVYATIYRFESETDKLAALIADNHVRLKNNWQLAQEAAALIEIEKIRAEDRQRIARLRLSHATESELAVHINAPQKTDGKARNEVGTQLGVSGFQVAEMIAVKETVEKLEQRGEFEKAEKLIELVNKNVQQAAKEARKEKRADLPLTVNKNWITLSEWEALDEAQQAIALDAGDGNSKFNRQSSDNIEWAQWSWNPITGCLHNCPYCYARDIANDKYLNMPEDDRFSPSFYPHRLNAPTNTKVPNLDDVDDPILRTGLRNVFTCSMADLFGKWVPTAWIEAVLQQIADNPQWTFLLLTKFPIRMAEFEYPPNTWIGTSVDRQYAVERAEKAFRKIRAGGYQGVAWLSCEPMMERLTFTSLDMFDWIVIGGASWSTQTPTYIPPGRDTIHLVNQADRAAVPIYMKTNLGFEGDARIREYPNIA